jgi:ParB family chromosome partitioning protein
MLTLVEPVVRIFFMVKKRGLGKSLDALLVGSSIGVAEDVQGNGVRREQLCHLPVDQVQRGKYQPRRAMDPEALDDLANSIRTQGVIQPIVVRRVLGGKYEIIAGERRWRAAQIAGLTEIPAVVREIPDEAAVAIALIENIQRENLNPIEEALALQRLLNEFSMTHQEVASAVGKSRTNVTNLLRLLTLTDEVKTMLQHGDLEMGHARALLVLPSALQIQAANYIVDKHLSVRETEELARKMQTPEEPPSHKSIDPDIKRLQDELSDRLGLAIRIKCNARGKGKLVISYNNLIELDALLELFQ